MPCGDWDYRAPSRSERERCEEKIRSGKLRGVAPIMKLPEETNSEYRDRVEETAVKAGQKVSQSAMNRLIARGVLKEKVEPEVKKEIVKGVAAAKREEMSLVLIVFGAILVLWYLLFGRIRK